MLKERIGRWSRRKKNEQIIAHPELRGSVEWSFRGRAGYQKGLEEIEKNLSFKKREGVYLFCREVAIAVKDSQNGQDNVLEYAQRLLSKGLLTDTELEYIYEQFKFDPSTYTPPKFFR